MAVINGTVVGAEAGFYPKEIEQSLRFEDGSSAYLSRTPASAGDRKTWTFSTWVKRGNLGAFQFLFGNGTATTTEGYQIIYFAASDSLDMLSSPNNAVNEFRLTTTQVFRDSSAWYHIVLSIDTTKNTSSDRAKLFVNGAQITSFSTETYPAQNTDLQINRTISHEIGKDGRDAQGFYLDGYLAETHFIDGTALDASSFGEFKNGVWIPKAYSGSYGTNGFYLDFADGGALGNDVSGNNNDWTATNLASTDVMLDSPTNNFATLNPLDRKTVGAAGATFSEGNLKNRSNGTNFSYVYSPSSIAVSSGKWYAEILVVEQNATTSSAAGITDNQITFTSATIPAGTIIGVSFDVDAGTYEYFKNNVSYSSGSLASSDVYTFFTGPITSGSGQICSQIANFGQDSSFAGNKVPQGYTDANGRGDFYYAPPAGYLALCTANLPEPVIGPNSATTSDEHFNTVLWTGNGTSQSIDVGFQPDFTWIKNRNDGAGLSHRLFDAVRGATETLYSNLTNAELTDVNSLTSFDTDGFSLGSTAAVNGSSNTQVAWNWKADNTSGSSNTDGSITSTVSANVDAGFSIVSWTSTGASESIGHGLGGQPELLIFKSRANADGWFVWTTGFNSSEYLLLNSTSAKLTYSTVWSTVPNSTVFGTTAASLAAGDAIAYCFHSVEGFSKFGSYTGNGSTDGPFIYTGFRPAFVMYKRTDAANDWIVVDHERNIYNTIDLYLHANLSAAENTADLVDFTSNGFKVRNSFASGNTSGGTYIYMAFAENPFKYSNAR